MADAQFFTIESRDDGLDLHLLLPPLEQRPSSCSAPVSFPNRSVTIII